MSIQKFFFEYNKFTLKSKFMYYSINISEAFLLSLLFAKPILNLDDKNALLFIGVFLFLAPVGILFVGGYNKIKAAFMKRHNLTESDF